MVICGIDGCTNSSKKKFKMNSIPRDPDKRALWLKYIDQPDWVPTEKSVVCEIHFAPEMWEKTRADGKRKLKHNAVPTIFDNQIKKPPNLQAKTPAERNQSNFENILIPNNETIIQILPAENTLNLDQVFLAIPTPPTSSFVNFKSLSSNSENINILQANSLTNSMNILQANSLTNSMKPSILLDNSILRNEIVINEDQNKIIICRNNDSSEVIPTDLIYNLTTSAIHVPDSTQKKTNSVQLILNTPTINAATKDQSKLVPVIVDTTDPSKISGKQSVIIPTTENSSNIKTQAKPKKKDDVRFTKMDKLLLKQLKLNDILRKKLVLLRRRIRRLLKNQEEKQGSVLFLKKVFTENQIKVLQLRHLNPNSLPTWSDDTMLKAIKLKKACGYRGYKEILNQNLPYPSFKTITRWCTAKQIETS